MAKSWKENNTLSTLKEDRLSSFERSFLNEFGSKYGDQYFSDVEDDLAQIKEILFGADNTPESWDAFDELHLVDDIMYNENADLKGIEDIDDKDSILWEMTRFCIAHHKKNIEVGDIYDLINKLYEL